MILISIARSSGAANKVPDILRNCLEKDKHVEVALPFRSSTVHSRSGGSYYLQFHKFSSIEDANMALTTLQSGLSIVPMVEIANTFPFPSLTKNDPGMFETNKSKKTFCSQYYNGNCKTPNCRFSHHPEVAFRAELNEPTASAIWSRDIRCGTWALKYGRTYPNNTDKGLQLFSKLLCLEAGKELQRANKLLASAIVDFRQCEALKNQYELDVHREEEIERSMEAPALPVPTTCALAGRVFFYFKIIK